MEIFDRRQVRLDDVTVALHRAGAAADDPIGSGA